METSIMTDNIIREVRKALDQLDEHAIADLTNAKIQTALYQACKQCDPDFEVYASKAREAREEWLYDVFCRSCDDDGYPKRNVLVAECERAGKGAVYDDFEKLLVARADVRIMLFNGNHWSEGERFEEFAKYVERCEHTVAGDIYLLVARVSNPERFQYYRIDAFQAKCILE